MFRFPDCPLKPGSTVWVYVRDSGGHGQDQLSQMTYLTAYCEHHDLSIAAVFTDSQSGKSVNNRYGLLEMMELARNARKPLVDGVVVWDLKRLSRNYNEGQWFLGELMSRGYTVLSASEEALEGTAGRIKTAFEFILGEEERRAIAENVRRGMDALYDMRDSDGNYLGLWPARTPRFFLSRRYNLGVRRNNGSQRTVNQIYPDPAMISTLGRAWEMKLGGATNGQIENELNLFGRSTSSRLKNQYKRLWSNRIYTGDLIRNGQLYENYVRPPMVSRDLWFAVRQLMEKRFAEKISNRTGTSENYLLNGRYCRCGYCGTLPMRTKTAKSRYYICKRKIDTSSNACTGGYINAARVERLVVDHVRHIYLTPEFFQTQAQAVNELIARRQADKSIVERLEQELDELYAKCDNLVAAIEDGEAPAALKAQLANREAEIKRVEAELHFQRENNREIQPLKVDPTLIAYAVDKMVGNLNSGANEVIKAVLQQAIQELAFYRDRIVLKYNFPLGGEVAVRFGLVDHVAQLYP